MWLREGFVSAWKRWGSWAFGDLFSGFKYSPERVSYIGQKSTYEVRKPAETSPFEVRYLPKTDLGK
jgi:hypothetical protein